MQPDCRVPHRRTIRGLITCLGLMIFLGLVTAPSTEAHHFKGLPHFNYFENYPQVPQEEYIWQEGDFEFSLVIYDFQGITRDDAEQPDDARLYVVVWSLRDNGIYGGPLSFVVLDGDDPVYEEAFAGPAEEMIYAMQCRLPDTGRYSLRVSAGEGAGPQAMIPFKLSSQKTPWGRWMAGILLVLVVIVAMGSRRARVVQDRRALARGDRRESSRRAKDDGASNRD